jgi:hypothetical protein
VLDELTESTLDELLISGFGDELSELVVELVFDEFIELILDEFKLLLDEGQQISSPTSCIGAAGNAITGHDPNINDELLDDSLLDELLSLENEDPLIGIEHGPVVV